MYNFSIREFHEIWDHISSFIAKHDSLGRDFRCKFQAMDVIFINLTTLKHGDNGSASRRCLI